MVDHQDVDRLGQDGPFLLQARRHAQGLLAVVEPKIAVGHARPAPGDRAGLAGPRQDPRTAPRGTQWRWNAREAGSPWPAARAASRAARSPDITPCAIGKASPPSCETARIGGLPRRCAGQATAPVATTRRDAVPVKPRCQAPLSHHRPLSDGRGGPRCRAGAVTGGVAGAGQQQDQPRRGGAAEWYVRQADSDACGASELE
jgi:hypothetical protein